MAHALRHAPWDYDLELDEEGWVPLDELVEALQECSRGLARLTEADVEEMLRKSDKQRFELEDGWIRAAYGHSLPGKLLREAATPPELLYHGTSPEAADVILLEGLKPGDRQYVHLSVDVVTATQVGQRRSERPVILEVLAGSAHASGVRFYIGNRAVWLADVVAPEWIRRRSE